jgi:hypothetical protein
MVQIIVFMPPRHFGMLSVESVDVIDTKTNKQTNLFLEYTHVIFSREYCRLNIVATRNSICDFASSQNSSTFSFADF